MIIALIILSICVIISLFMIANLYSKNYQLLREINELSQKSSDSRDVIEIEQGDVVIIPDYGLIHNQGEKTEHHFLVTYEAEVIDLTKDMAKVKILNYTSRDREANDPNYKQAIINFMNEKWIEISKLELIMNETKRRDIKLKELLKDE